MTEREQAPICWFTPQLSTNGLELGMQPRYPTFVAGSQSLGPSLLPPGGSALLEEEPEPGVQPRYSSVGCSCPNHWAQCPLPAPALSAEGSTDRSRKDRLCASLGRSPETHK